jgi:hypothetical protein
MPGSIDLVPLAVLVTLFWILTVIFRARSRHHLYPVFRRALWAAVVVTLAVFCWNLALSFR